MPATVWVRPAGGTWQPVGSSDAAGVWHEGLVAVSDQWGPKTLTFTLKRQPRAVFPDLLTRTPIAVDVDGVRVWRGRIKDVPEQSGAIRQLTVQCEGGQTILDRDQLERVLVHTDLSAYKDQRSMLAANLTGSTQAWNVTASGGVIAIGFQNGALIGNGTFGGVTLDLGPGGAARRVVVTWESSNNTGDASFRVRGSDTADPSGSDNAFTFALNTGASGTTAGTFISTHRYVHLYLFSTITFGPAVADVSFRIKSCQVFADTAYESGNQSVLSAKTIITDVLTRATTGLHPDWTGIGDPAFAFPEYAPGQPRTARETVAAANAPHGWRFKIDENLRPVYQARATVPVVELGAWLGAEGDTGSSNSDEGVVTKVIVRGTGPDGSPIRSTGTQTGTIVDRQGDVACVTLDASYKLTQTFADKLRDTHLATHRVSPFKGQNVVTGAGARAVKSGATVYPAHLLLLTGEVARRTDLVNPDTGGVGRTAVIDQVTYRDDQGIAEVDLDNTRRDFDALQARLGLLVPT